MVTRLFRIIVALAGASLAASAAESAGFALAQRHWVETRSAHFNIYSCAAQSDVFALGARLEQFSEAFALLAGAQALSSPPIIVMAFPDHEAMAPFLPLYQGKPGNFGGFFKRGSDENLIVLALPSTNSAFTGLEVIFHEYAHLLFRRNGHVWPLWLNEGIADVYSTFESSGFIVRIGKPIEPYVELLQHRPLMPLHELFVVNQDSPAYNETSRQGIFYAQSWLLTHYLMSGGTVGYQARFARFTQLLRDGQVPEQAFTNALQTSLPAMEQQLNRYLERGVFSPMQWALPMSVDSAKAMSTRVLTPVEVYFRLGSELLRIKRYDTAGIYFERAKKLAPASPLPYEGLGMLAAAQEQHANAVQQLKEALQRGSGSFLAHYVYAREKYQLTADAQNRFSPLPQRQAVELQTEWEKAIALMPSFGPAYESLGFFEMVQADDLNRAEKHLELAVQLEPDNPSYLIGLAQAQLSNHKPDAARRTIGPLLLPTAEPRLRKPAEELLKEINATQPKP